MSPLFFWKQSNFFLLVCKEERRDWFQNKKIHVFDWCIWEQLVESSDVKCKGLWSLKKEVV